MVCTASRDVFSPSRSQNNLHCFLVRDSDCGHTPASDRLDRLCLGLQARGLGWRAVLSGNAGAAPWSPRVLGLGGAADAPFPSATLELERLTGLRSHSRRLQAPGSSVAATIQCSSPLWVPLFPRRPQLETSVSEAQPHGWGRRCTTVGTGSPRRRGAPSGFLVALGTSCPRRGAGTLQRERPTYLENLHRRLSPARALRLSGPLRRGPGSEGRRRPHPRARTSQSPAPPRAAGAAYRGL